MTPGEKIADALLLAFVCSVALLAAWAFADCLLHLIGRG